MLKDLDAGVAFYRDGLGLRLRRGGEAMAEFDTGGMQAANGPHHGACLSAAGLLT